MKIKYILDIENPNDMMELKFIQQAKELSIIVHTLESLLRQKIKYGELKKCCSEHLVSLYEILPDPEDL